MIRAYPFRIPAARGLVAALCMAAAACAAFADVPAVLDSASLHAATQAAPGIRYTVRQDARPDRSVLVGWEDAGFDGTFVVRSDIDRDGRALSGRPNGLDMKLLKVMERERIGSVGDYARWLRRSVVYRPRDGKAAAKSPADTVDRKCGDCLEIALLNEASLRVFGYRPQVWAMARLFENHTICVFRKDGRYCWFDNTLLHETAFATIDGLKQDILKSYRMYYLYDVDTAGAAQ